MAEFNIDGIIQKEYQIVMTGSPVNVLLAVLKNQSENYRFVLESEDGRIVYKFSKDGQNADDTRDGDGMLPPLNFSIADGAIFQTNVTKTGDDPVYLSCIGPVDSVAYVKLINKF